MAGVFIFDTLQYVKKLKEAGVGEEVAEVHAEAMKGIIDSNLATKGDIRAVKHDIEIVKSDIQTVRSELKHDIELVKKDLTIRMGSMFALTITMISVLITLLNKFH
jgi:hypothetical protein